MLIGNKQSRRDDDLYITVDDSVDSLHIADEDSVDYLHITSDDSVDFQQLIDAAEACARKDKTFSLETINFAQAAIFL